ncbi:hypothetical protein CMI42_00525 [Candidatus Pacearchaeota archaeon]|nr:hypothetical protein [Candidatus Pacearchaeota archaeon]|tara:strand:- start:2951 stop:4102 length:1152 start_codon:yes stop_codon:yes gene_type:complete
MKTDTVKGFRDIEDAGKRSKILEIIERTFRLYNYKRVETPIIEYEEFVKGDNEKDEAVSDIFKLSDKGNRKLALRYEFTFQLKRLMKNKKLPYKRYQIGPVFRNEPISGNRWRQFTQCDMDVIGARIEDVGEILAMTSNLLDELKVKSTIYVNNRKLLNEILESVGIVDDKEEVIREIDKLDKLGEKEVRANLKRYEADKVLSIFKKDEKYFERFDGYKDIKKLKRLLKVYGVKVKFSPFLARGLSYYNWIVFEVKSNVKETITAGGGSYMINNVQGSGISFGLDRLEVISKIEDDVKKVLIINMDSNKESIGIADKIRKEGVVCEVYNGKIGKGLDYANSIGIDKVIIVGEEEVKSKKYTFKNMKSGKEKKVNEEELLRSLK